MQYSNEVATEMNKTEYTINGVTVVYEYEIHPEISYPPLPQKNNSIPSFKRPRHHRK